MSLLKIKHPDPITVLPEVRAAWAKEDEMTHRVIDIEGIAVQVFDTRIAAQIWLKKNQGDSRVLVRNSRLFVRKDGHEMEVKLNATSTDANRHLLTAANNIADAVEKAIERQAEGTS